MQSKPHLKLSHRLFTDLMKERKSFFGIIVFNFTANLVFSFLEQNIGLGLCFIEFKPNSHNSLYIDPCLVLCTYPDNIFICLHDLRKP